MNSFLQCMSSVKLAYPGPRIAEHTHPRTVLDPTMGTVRTSVRIKSTLRRVSVGPISFGRQCIRRAVSLTRPAHCGTYASTDRPRPYNGHRPYKRSNKINLTAGFGRAEFIRPTVHQESGQPTQARALRNIRIHGPSSSQSSGYHECVTARNTRSGCGIMMVTRPSAVVSPVMPCGEPFGFCG